MHVKRFGRGRRLLSSYKFKSANLRISDSHVQGFYFNSGPYIMYILLLTIGFTLFSERRISSCGFDGSYFAPFVKGLEYYY